MLEREIPKDGRFAVAALAVGFVFLNHQLRAEKKDPKHHPEIKHHLHAKKFDASQKAVIASRLMPFYTQAAKERQRQSGGDVRGKTVVEKIPPQKTKARDEAGKAAGVNGRYVDALERKRESILRPLAKDSMKEGNSRGGKGGKSSAILPTTSKIDTRKECAKAAGVSSPASSSGWRGLAWRRSRRL